MAAPLVELLRPDADAAGRLPEALLGRQLGRLRGRRRAPAVDRLRRRPLPVALPGRRGAAEDGAGAADGAAPVHGHRPRGHAAHPQGQPALRHGVLRTENHGRVRVSNIFVYRVMLFV